MNIENLRVGDIIEFKLGVSENPFGDEVNTSVGVIMSIPSVRDTTTLGDFFRWEYIMDVQVGEQKEETQYYTGRTKMIERVYGQYDLSQPRELLTIIDYLYERNRINLSAKDREQNKL